MSTAKKVLVVGNWKMYISEPRAAADFARALRRRSRLFSGVEAAIAPCFPLIPSVVAVLHGSAIRVGAQALSPFEAGPHTGEVSAEALVGAGAEFVIVGHSERRARGESDDAIAEELMRAEVAGLRFVLCIGESERDQAGMYFEVLKHQLHAALAGKPAARKLAIAYEPVWAIGKGPHDAIRPEELRETIIFIRKELTELLGRDAAMRVPLLYGGSVEPANVRGLLEEGGVSGFLVGHASADLDAFLEILKTCRR